MTPENKKRAEHGANRKPRSFRQATLACHPIVLLASVLLLWNGNRENDLAGYRVYVGERSGRYNQVHSTGLQTFLSLDKLSPGKTYYFAVTAYDLSGNESGFSEEVSLSIPGEIEPPQRPQIASEKSLALNYNFPNPFNAEIETTALRYYLSEGSEITIRIFDVKGDLVKETLFRKHKSAGEHTEDFWDGTNGRGEKVAAGLYYCEISTTEQSKIFRIAVVRR
jgi:hypothetical protein